MNKSNVKLMTLNRLHKCISTQAASQMPGPMPPWVQSLVVIYHVVSYDNMFAGARNYMQHGARDVSLDRFLQASRLHTPEVYATYPTAKTLTFKTPSPTISFHSRIILKGTQNMLEKNECRKCSSILQTTYRKKYI